MGNNVTAGSERREMAERVRALRLEGNALKFLWEQMEKAGPLSAMAKLSPRGVVWTYLPPGAEHLQASKDFEEGGVFDSESAGGILQEVVTFMRVFLQEDPFHIILCEDRFFGIDDPPNLQDQDIFECRGVTYHYRTHSFKEASTREFEETIGSASNYPIILLLTKTGSPESLPRRTVIKESLAHELADGILHIIVGAYDEEGYLIWSCESPDVR